MNSAEVLNKYHGNYALHTCNVVALLLPYKNWNKRNTSQAVAKEGRSEYSKPRRKSASSISWAVTKNGYPKIGIQILCISRRSSM